MLKINTEKDTDFSLGLRKFHPFFLFEYNFVLRETWSKKFTTFFQSQVGLTPIVISNRIKWEVNFVIKRKEEIIIRENINMPSFIKP